MLITVEEPADSSICVIDWVSHDHSHVHESLVRSSKLSSIANSMTCACCASALLVRKPANIFYLTICALPEHDTHYNQLCVICFCVRVCVNEPQVGSVSPGTRTCSHNNARVRGGGTYIYVIYVSIHYHVHVRMDMCMCVCTYTCPQRILYIYIYTHTYMCVYIYMYIYTYITHTSRHDISNQCAFRCVSDRCAFRCVSDTCIQISVQGRIWSGVYIMGIQCGQIHCIFRLYRYGHGIPTHKQNQHSDKYYLENCTAHVFHVMRL